ncbi:MULTISPECIES: hypothetical protein [unclassified Spiroplasma]|uniref:hypothetical protein n=1 Tax=unclassified Spiroplasma TaxID=2637901 RepID=UPI00313D3268
MNRILKQLLTFTFIITPISTIIGCNTGSFNDDNFKIKNAKLAAATNELTSKELNPLFLEQTFVGDNIVNLITKKLSDCIAGLLFVYVSDVTIELKDNNIMVLKDVDVINVNVILKGKAVDKNKTEVKIERKITINEKHRRVLDNEASNILNKFETIENAFHYHSIKEMTYALQQQIPNNKENDLMVNIEIDNNDWEQVMQTEPTVFYALKVKISILHHTVLIKTKDIVVKVWGLFEPISNYLDNFKDILEENCYFSKEEVIEAVKNSVVAVVPNNITIEYEVLNWKDPYVSGTFDAVVIVKAIKDGKEINTIQVNVKVKELKSAIKSYLSKFKNINVPKYYHSEDEVMQAIKELVDVSPPKGITIVSKVLHWDLVATSELSNVDLEVVVKAMNNTTEVSEVKLKVKAITCSEKIKNEVSNYLNKFNSIVEARAYKNEQDIEQAVKNLVTEMPPVGVKIKYEVLDWKKVYISDYDVQVKIQAIHNCEILETKTITVKVLASTGEEIKDYIHSELGRIFPENKTMINEPLATMAEFINYLQNKTKDIYKGNYELLIVPNEIDWNDKVIPADGKNFGQVTVLFQLREKNSRDIISDSDKKINFLVKTKPRNNS